MAPYPRMVTSAPVRPSGRVWIVMTARYCGRRLQQKLAAIRRDAHV